MHDARTHTRTDIHALTICISAKWHLNMPPLYIYVYIYRMEIQLQIAGCKGSSTKFCQCQKKEEKKKKHIQHTSLGRHSGPLLPVYKLQVSVQHRENRERSNDEQPSSATESTFRTQ